MSKLFPHNKTIEHKWAAVVKNPRFYIDPYKVVVGSLKVFHSWHKTKASAVAEAKRINKVHGGWFETKTVKSRSK